MEIFLWMFIGFFGYFFIAAMEWYPKYLSENFFWTQGFIFAMLGPTVWICWMLRPFVWTFPKFIFNSIYEQIDSIRTKKYDEEKTQQRKIAAEERKIKAKKSYPILMNKCQEIISSYEKSDVTIKISFYDNCIKLISYANQKLSEDILNRESLLAVLKFARINIFTFLENEDEKKVQKISDSLAKAIKNFSKK